ncbi:MAG TPA: ATP-binding cassette domain-containing protein, partial [Spirochaetia bacterium]|nr:ATP-binding cassette domain-containing protein [Spirochaetia bacterium]
MPQKLPDATGEVPHALLRMRGIVVAYGSLLANDHVDLEVRAGDIHALLGENGAGKTTLMKALVGLAPLADGTIEMDGRALPAMTPLAARDAGIGMVHQHFMLIPTLTVAQNVCIGLRSEGYPFPDYRRVIARLEALSVQYRLKVDPVARVSGLSVGEQQRVEILRALYRGARLLVLDEPTSVLIPQEVDGLFEIIRGLSADGTAVIFISHKLNEVMSICRDVTILRAGRVAARRRVADTDARELARLMVGRDMEALPPAAALTVDAPVVARLRGIRCTDSRGVRKLNGIDLDVRAGEIHGIAGVDGNGQGELAAIIAGLLAPSGGTLHLGGADITRMHPS